jgi:hypothetical protein
MVSRHEDLEIFFLNVRHQFFLNKPFLGKLLQIRCGCPYETYVWQIRLWDIRVSTLVTVRYLAERPYFELSSRLSIP